MKVARSLVKGQSWKTYFNDEKRFWGGGNAAPSQVPPWATAHSAHRKNRHWSEVSKTNVKMGAWGRKETRGKAQDVMDEGCGGGPAKERDKPRTGTGKHSLWGQGRVGKTSEELPLTRINP